MRDFRPTHRTSFPPPCGEGLRVGVSPRLRALGHPHPCPLPTRGRETCWLVRITPIPVPTHGSSPASRRGLLHLSTRVAPSMVPGFRRGSPGLGSLNGKLIPAHSTPCILHPSLRHYGEAHDAVLRRLASGLDARGRHLHLALPPGSGSWGRFGGARAYGLGDVTGRRQTIEDLQLACTGS